MSSRERKQSNQGHQAKMNSSDWSGLENQDSEDGWTRVLHKSSRKKLRNQKKSKDGERKQHKADNSALPSEGRSRSSSSSRARSRSRDSDSPLEQEQRELKQAGAREVADKDLMQRASQARDLAPNPSNRLTTSFPKLQSAMKLPRSRKAR